MQFKIHHYPEIDSTNQEAFRKAREGAPAGSVFVADYQTNGRGKWGRDWVSPKGKNLLFSILLYPSMKVMSAASMTQTACRSVAKVLQEKCGLHPTFKRPNDVLIKGRKICGVLVEAKGRVNGDLDSLVIGIGLNVNASPEELLPTATSVLEETGRKWSCPALLKALLSQIGKDLKCFS